MNNMIGKYKNIVKMVLPALIIIICYVISIKFGSMVYLTNDDTSIQDVLSGSITGQPYPIHQFINVLVGFPLAMLYKIFPTIQWWYVWSHILIIVGLLFINYSIVVISKKNNYPYVMAICLASLVDVGFVFYTISNVSFTIVPAILGAGLIALLFFLNDKNKNILLIVGALCYTVLFSHRSMVGKVIMCYILLVVLHYFMSENLWKKEFRKLCLIFVGVVCFSVCLDAGNYYYQAHINGDAFQRYNNARISYIDYPHDAFEENPEIYENVGWDYDIYKLVQNWCFLDENVTAESLEYLSDQSNEYDGELKNKLLWEQMITELINPLVVAVMVIWLISVLICFGAIISGDKLVNLITLAFNLGGSLAFIAYQFYSGRILYRSLVTILLPSVIINIMLMITSYSNTRNKKVMYALFAIFAGVSIWGSQEIVKQTFDTDRLSNIEASAAKEKTLREYAIENKDNVYIKQTGITFNINPFGTDSSDRPTNIIRWGESTFYSDAFCKKLANNDIDALNGSVFKRDNVYLIFNFDATEVPEIDEDNIFGIFYSWLKNHYEAIGFNKEDTICEGLYVYKFVFEHNVEQFDYYYDFTDGKLFQCDVK